MLGCVAHAFIQPVRASPPGVPRLEQYCVNRRGAELGDLVNEVDADVRNRGAEGYELAAMVSRGFDLMYCFRRPAR
jgi:hypothetical protein